MTTLRQAACRESTGMSHPRMETYLRFLAERLSAPDYAEAESLLHAAIDPVHAARRHGEAADDRAVGNAN